MNHTVRTYDKFYIDEVDKWWDVLLPKMKKWLHVSTGGPILMVQLENEYGSYGDTSANAKDRKYMEHLLEKAREHLGNEVSFYTTDGGAEAYISHGRVDGVYACGDGAPDIAAMEQSFQAMKKLNPKGRSPNFNSELYTGWLTHWTEPAMQNSPTKTLRDAVAYLVNSNASFNLYMAHGGTNFGFTSGANDGGNATSQLWIVTSYDYAAPIAEDGRHNLGSDGLDKFSALKTILNPRGPDVPLPSFMKLKKPIKLSLRAARDTFAENCKHWKKLSPDNAFPKDYFAVFELLRFSPGNQQGTRTVALTDFADALYAYLPNNEMYWTRPTPSNGTSLRVVADASDRLDVVIESMGHIGFGSYMARDMKGVKIDDPNNDVGGSWEKCFFSQEDIEELIHRVSDDEEAKKVPVNSTGTNPQPALFVGTFYITGPRDTYLDVDSQKGSAFVNGVALGRYWNVGPQKKLYVPSSFLRTGTNVLAILEFLSPEKSVTDMREARLGARDIHTDDSFARHGPLHAETIIA